MAAKLLLLLLFLFSFGPAPSCSMTGGVRIELSYVQSTDVQTPLYAGSYEFLMELAIGTPTVSYSAVMDTGSDLIWTQCQTLYDPSGSSTYATLPCNASQCLSLGNASRCLQDEPAADCRYYYGYLDNSSTQGVLGTETFTFGSVAVPGVAFGCGNSSGDFDNSSGIVGMGRGNLSLVFQLGDGRFSYCLTPYSNNNKSLLFLGAMATLSAQAQSTPFVANPTSFDNSSYYLSLQGITVGETKLPIPNTTFIISAEDGTGGVIIDSGTPMTRLVDPAYAMLKQEFESQMNLSAYGYEEYDICFTYGSEAVQGPSGPPTLVFHFEGADMNIPPENYIRNLSDSSLSLQCVMVARQDVAEYPSIFGNFMQQNMHVLYDLAGELLSFEPEQCAQL